MEAYKDPSRPVDARLADLMARMSLEEKLGQMVQLPANEPANVEALERLHIGSYLHISSEMMAELEARAARTRLGIPLIFGIDAIHGHCFDPDGTVYPTQLAMACAWDRGLAREVGRATAREVAACGIHWTFSPVLCVARDLRWGRVDETFGEDPWLCGELAQAMVEGYQGGSLSSGALSDEARIIASAKHYAAYGEATGGRDAYEAPVSRMRLLQDFLPPFERAIKAGCGSLMTAYHSIDGLPCTASRWLLTEKAKEEWGLDGFVVTDWNNVENLVTRQRVARDIREAARLAIMAGNDMIMSTPGFYAAALDLVRSGEVPEALIDAACARVLKAKFRLGLFEGKRRFDAAKRAATLGAKEHQDLALSAAREGLVLLKNEGLLPLDLPAGGRLVLIGPYADDVAAQLGDWSFGSNQIGAYDDRWHREGTVTLRAGLEAACDARGLSFEYEPGLDAARARDACARADAVVLVVGDTLKDHGEFKDRADLSLDPGQKALFMAARESGKPLVLVLMASKPLALPEEVEASGAFVVAFNPGCKGGIALADALFGEADFTGRLPLSFPRHSGQVPVHYQFYPGWHSKDHEFDPEGGRYEDFPDGPLFAFGEGMGYGKATVVGARLERDLLKEGEALRALIRVRGDAKKPSTVLAQAYVRDLVASVTLPDKRLAGFVKARLKPGEERELAIDLPFESLSLVNADLRRLVEPGDFELLVGTSSRARDLRTLKFRMG
jgi:beta-glucosidase